MNGELFRLPDKLEWRRIDDDWWVCRTILGKMTLVQADGSETWFATPGFAPSIDAATVDAAKAYCEDHYRSRLRAALVPVDAGALAERVVDQLLARNRHHELRVCKSDGTSLAIWTWEDAVEDVNDILEAMNQ
jgi:hypothetical protein